MNFALQCHQFIVLLQVAYFKVTARHHLDLVVFYYADNGHLDIINFDLFAFFDGLLVHTLSDFLFDLSNSGIVAVLERYSDIYDGLAEVKRVVANAEHRLLS